MNQLFSHRCSVIIKICFAHICLALFKNLFGRYVIVVANSRLTVCLTSFKPCLKEPSLMCKTMRRLRCSSGECLQKLIHGQFIVFHLLIFRLPTQHLSIYKCYVKNRNPKPNHLPAIETGRNVKAKKLYR